MSLKAVHIFFITLSILLALGFAAWEIQRYIATGELVDLISGIFSFVIAVGLIVYGLYFLRKLKHVRLI
ncbi:MAG: hypothetical protein C4326_03575 [Ignavibacteria bacterium]